MHKIYFDGGTKLNSTCLYDVDLNFYDVRKVDSKMTNNQLEYMGLLSALVYASAKYKLKECCFVGDSKLIIEQMRGDFLVNNNKLKKLNELVSEFIVRINGCLPIVDMFEWVPRERNYAGIHLERLG